MTLSEQELSKYQHLISCNTEEYEYWEKTLTGKCVFQNESIFYELVVLWAATTRHSPPVHNVHCVM